MFSIALKMKSKLPTMSYVKSNSHLISLPYTHSADILPESPHTGPLPRPTLCLGAVPSSSHDFSATPTQLKCQTGQSQSSFLHSQSCCIQFSFLYIPYDYLKLVFLRFLYSLFSSCYHKNTNLRNTYALSPLLSTVYPTLKAHLDTG